MKMFSKILVSIVILLSCNLNAQDSSIVTQNIPRPTYNIQDTLFEDSVFFKTLPPLGALLDSAVNHDPNVNRQDYKIKETTFQQKETKQEWLKYFRLYANSNYGIYDNFVSANDGSIVASTITTGSAFRYSVGLSIGGAPLYEFFHNKTKIKILEMRKMQAVENKKEFERNIRLEVINQYNTLLSDYQLLKVRNANMLSNYTQMTLVEQQFLNGQTSLGELARFREIYYKSRVAYEKKKFEFINSYMILQELVGFKF